MRLLRIHLYLDCALGHERRTGRRHRLAISQQTKTDADLWGAFDVLPNGDFVMVEPAEWEKKPVRIHVVTNWAADLEQLK